MWQVTVTVESPTANATMHLLAIGAPSDLDTREEQGFVEDFAVAATAAVADALLAFSRGRLQR